MHDDARPDRPSWLAMPCPTWCTAVHLERDQPAERLHVGERRDVELTLAPPVEVDPAEDASGWAAPLLTFYVAQHYREAEPRVWAGEPAGAGVWLTLEEAATSSSIVAELVAEIG